MFGTVLTIIVTLMLIYLFWHISSIDILNRFISKTHIGTCFIIVWSIFLSGRIFRHSGTNFDGLIEFFSMNLLGISFLSFITFLCVDIITGFGLLFKAWISSIKKLTLIFSIGLSSFALFQGMMPPITKNYEVYLSDLPKTLDGTTVVAISDMHLGSLIGRKWLIDRLSQIRAESPDLIFLLGDIIEGHGKMDNGLIEEFKNLNAKFGVWAVLGNHESHEKNNNTNELYNKAGIKLLKNTWLELQPGLILIGVDDLTRNIHSSGKKDILSEALKNVPEGAKILLSHSPLETEKAAQNGVGLMLSGHTHGGQVWPFNYLVKTRYPLIAGEYNINGMPVIVSRGTGTWGPRMRLWHRGEILRITLHSKTNSY